MGRSALPIMLLGGAALIVLMGKKGKRRYVSVARSYSDDDDVIDPGMYPASLEEWESMKQRFDLHGATFMGRVPGNGISDSKHKHGARSALIYIPPTFSSAKPYELIYFLHGLNGYLKKDRVGMSLQAMEAQDRNFILVVPELPWSHHATPFKRQREAYTGSDDENFLRFYREVTGILQKNFGLSEKPKKITFIGHSAGGSALRAIASSEAMDEIVPDLIIWSDSTYTTWLDEMWEDYRNRDRSKFVIFNMYDSSDKKPFKQTERFLESLGGKPANMEVVKFTYDDGWTHTKLGNNVLPMSLQA